MPVTNAFLGSKKLVDCAIVVFNKRLRQGDPEARKAVQKAQRFVVHSKNGREFAPLKEVVVHGDSPEAHKKLMRDKNSNQAVTHMIGLGYHVSKYHFDELEAWLEQNNIPFKTKFPSKWSQGYTILNYVNHESIAKLFHNLTRAQIELQNKRVIFGHQNVQGALGEWLFEKGFDAERLPINEKGADFLVGKLRFEIKTKRPAASNPAGCQVKATKFSEGGCHWLVVFWMRFDYRVDALILVPLTVLKKMYASSFKAGKSIEVHPKHFVNQFSNYCARSIQDLSTVAWKDKIADKKILKGFFS